MYIHTYKHTLSLDRTTLPLGTRRKDLRVPTCLRFLVLHVRMEITIL